MTGQFFQPFPIKSPKSIGLLLLSFWVAALIAHAAQADSPNRAGLVVVHGDTVVTRCVEFEEEKISGYDLLARSGLDVNADFSNSIGVAVCRIDGQGCTYPQDSCFCQCEGASCTFWSYWYLDDNEWTFSNLGPSNRNLRSGQVDGWTWGESSSQGDGKKSPDYTFEQICAPPTNTPEPTATPSPTPTETAPPTNTPEPTATETAPPTNTPEPTSTFDAAAFESADAFQTVDPPQIHHFTADRQTSTRGEAVLLKWDLSDAKSAYLRYNGVEEGVISPGSKTVSPTADTVYTLVAVNDGGQNTRDLTITVNQPLPTAPPTDTPHPTAPPIIARPTATTQLAQAIIAPSPTIAPLPTATSPPMPTAPLEPNPLPATTAASIAEIAPTVTSPPILSPTEPLPTATVGAMRAEPTLTVNPLPKPRPLSPSPSAAADHPLNLWLIAGLTTTLCLLILLPLGLIGTGWLVWWLRGRSR